MVAEDAEIAQSLALGLLEGHGGGRGGGLEADGEKDHLALGIGAGDGQGVLGRIDHADIGPGGLGLEQAMAVGGRHPHQVGVGAEGQAMALGHGDGQVEAGGGQNADRAAGAVDEAHLGGHQVLDTVAEDGVGVAAAKLHEAVGPALGGLLGDGGGEAPGQVPIAELIDEFHAAARSPAAAIKARVRSASSGLIRPRA